MAGLLIGLAFAFLVIGSVAIRSGSKNSAAAADKESVAHALGEDMSQVSDFLTDQVRAFAVTHDRAYLDAYWEEVESTRRRESILDKASRLRLPKEELNALRRAKSESDLLIGTEKRAIRLVAEAIGYAEGDMPPAIAALPLSRKDSALTWPEKLGLARELVFGAEYWEHKREIRKAIEDFRVRSTARTAAAVRAAQAGADRGFLLVISLTVLAFMGMVLVAAFYYRFVASPIRNYIRTITTANTEADYPELHPEGAFELVALAEAINAQRAQRISTESALRDSELRLRTNLLMMPLAAMEIDGSGGIRSWNPSAELMFGYLEKEVLGKDINELIVPENLRPEMLGIIDRLAQGEVIDRQVNENITKDGRFILCEWYNTPLYDAKGAWLGWVSLVKDITEQQAEADKVLYLSRHDPLTGLLNRRSMQERLEEEHLRSKRTGGAYSCVMLDIDKFKNFNDNYGHECGDVVLKGVGDAIVGAVRSTDSVGRWGGEEFLVLLPETNMDGGLELAEKIRSRIQVEAIAYGENSFKVTVTAGIAACAESEESVDDCIRRADEALLAGKAQGRNRVVAS